MAEKLKITILTDRTSWMNGYNESLAEKLKELGHCVGMVHSKTELEPGDIVFFLSCFEIVSVEYLKLSTHNIVVHASELPKGKGWSPASWQILEGRNEIPLTLFEAVNEVDAGAVYIRDVLKLDGTELIAEWQKKLGDKIVQMSCDFVSNLSNLKPVCQSGESSFYKKRTHKDSELDINKTIAEQFNLLRVVDNDKYPAFFNYKDKKYSIRIEAFE